MANAFVHTELNTTDVGKAKGFYGKLFDWKLEDMPMDGGSYTMIKIGEGTVGGIMANPVPGAPSFWLSYVLVDDIEASTAKARSLGAHRDEGCHRGHGHGMAQRDRRSHRRRAGDVEAEAKKLVRGMPWVRRRTAVPTVALVSIVDDVYQRGD